MSSEIASYLDDMARLAIHGSDKAEVARVLVGEGIRLAIRQDFIKLKQSVEPSTTHN